MIESTWGVVRDGKIELTEDVQLPEGARALVTLAPDEEASFWLALGESSLDAVWNNEADDVYGQLLEE